MTDYATLLQASTLKQRLGMQKFGSFIAGLFTAKKSVKRSSGTVTACILCFFIIVFSSDVHMSSSDRCNAQIPRRVLKWKRPDAMALTLKVCSLLYFVPGC